MKKSIFFFCFYICITHANAQTILFSYDFTTSYISSMTGTGQWCAASPNNNSMTGCTSYGWSGYSSFHYITTRAITIPVTGQTSLQFVYRYPSSSLHPVVQISNSCAGTFTTLKTLLYKSSCGPEIIDLTSYAGQTVYIKFKSNSSTYFYLDDVTVVNTPNCICSCAGSCIDSDISGNWNDCNTWGSLDMDVSCIGWATATIMGNRKQIISSGHTVTVPSGISTYHDKSLGIYIQSGGTLTLNDELDGTNSTNADKIYVCGTMNVSHSGTSDFSAATLTVGEGGVLNINSGILSVDNIIVENGGVINMNGGELRYDNGSIGIWVKEGGLININSGASKINYNGFSSIYTKIDGTVDCKNNLTSSNYYLFEFGDISVTANTSTGRIKSQNPYTVGGNYSNITANNNFFGFNSTYGGTVEYYGSSSIFLSSIYSRYYYYDLEVNTSGGLYLGASSCTNLTGNLYLTSGNLFLNGKQINIHGTIIYSGSNFISSTSTGKIHMAGKTSSVVSPCMNYFSSITTDLPSGGGTSIYSQGGLVDIKHPELRFTSAGGGNANISELKIFRSDLVILKDNLTVYDLLSVKVGVLKTLTNTVFLNNSGTTALEYQTTNYSAPSTVGWISGNLKRRCATGWTYDFPVGRTDVSTFPGDYMKYRHFRITFTSVSPSPCYVTVNFNTTFNPGDCNGALDNAWDLGVNYVQLHPEGWWSVIPDAITSIDYDAYGYIHGFTIPLLSDNKFGLLKRPDGSTSCLDWTNGGGTLNAANTSGRIHEYSGSLEIGYAQRNGLTGLSEFAIGMTNQEMLPVDLLYFYPSCHDDAVEIQWGTASETNCQQFTLEKLSGDDEWQQIQVVPGAGNSNSVLHYTVKDVLPENNIPVYYRMIQTDFNGAQTIYGPVPLKNCESGTGSFEIVSMMQADGQLQIVCFNPESIVLTEVYDITGKSLFMSSYNNSAGYQLISIPVDHWQNQILMIRLFNGKDVINKKHCLY